jgi:hypothetical protein
LSVYLDVLTFIVSHILEMVITLNSYLVFKGNGFDVGQNVLEVSLRYPLYIMWHAILLACSQAFWASALLSKVCTVSHRKGKVLRWSL